MRHSATAQVGWGSESILATETRPFSAKETLHAFTKMQRRIPILPLKGFCGRDGPRRLHMQWTWYRHLHQLHAVELSPGARSYGMPLFLEAFWGPLAEENPPTSGGKHTTATQTRGSGDPV